MKILSPLAVYLAALLGAGCANSLKSEYQPPEVKYPANWYQEDAAGETAPFDWQAFNDPDLDGWLRQFMARNNDVGGAVLRVYRARLDEERTGIASDPGLKGSLDINDTGPAGWNRGSFTSLSTRYELDLWGKVARQRDAKAWAREASEEDLRSARLTLLTDASNNYWRIGFINQQLSVLQQSVDYAKETLRLAKARYAAGGAFWLDVKIARNDYEQRVLEFKQELYKAMSSIEDALSLRNQLLAQETLLREGLELAKKSERLNEVRYRQGAVLISFWLDAQEKCRQVRLPLNENRYNELKNLVKIYMEFGGSATYP